MINVGNLLVKRNKVRIALGIQAFSVGEFKFEVMALEPSYIETLECHDTHAEMLCYAADNGVVINNELMSNDMELTDRLAEFWAENEDSELRQAVGVEVCKLSGLTTYMNERLEAEKEESGFEAIEGESKEDEAVRFVAHMEDQSKKEDQHLSGDDLGDLSATLGQTEAEKLAVESANYIANQ